MTQAEREFKIAHKKLLFLKYTRWQYI